ncbi:ATP-binding cassette domain-containing protein [Halosegnis longus]|uniref:ATP-binding cassette domain-containing protein n=1 Tax=Halosegnis longus TaxID=2216012 RepID=UPI00096A8B6D|nr:ABC transporter ATP-binding protein [Salella cibi]
MTHVTLDSVRKQYDQTTAVNGLSFDIAEGETLGVVGPSGCGKTTTLRTVAGFETPTEGTVAFGGRDVTHVPPEQRNVGLVFQSYALFDNMTVRQNVAFGPRMAGVGKTERRERADDLLDMLGIGELGDRDPTTLSGGQQQRVGLARALAIEPEILLLDEPMTGLDAKLKRRLRREISALLDDLDVTALYVTHDQAEAMEMCDRIAVLSDGKLEQVATPTELYEEPANEFVADFIGSSTLLSGPVRDGHIDAGPIRIPAPTATAATATAAVRPGAFVYGDDFEATVTDRAYLGGSVRGRATLADGQSVELRLDEIPEPGATVSLALDESRVHVLDS